jgi:predicted PurR-regulated permease PerM
MLRIDREYKLPFYAKATIFLIGLIALFTILYIAQGIIVPLVFAVIIAIVLHPVVNFFVRMRINRIVAISVTLLLTFLIIAGFSILIISQATQFGESWPILVEKFTGVVNETITWASGYFDINPQRFHDWITHNKSEFTNINSIAIGQTIITVGSGILILFLVPVYVFIILYYQPLLLDFIHKLFGNGNQGKVSEIITQTKMVIQRYLIGLFIEFAMVAALNTTVLFILGIEYAILLGIIGALLNLIPYIGGIVGVALPMMVALATKSTAWYAFYVLVLYYIIQLIDNNYIVPIIVSSKVKINALFSIIVVIAGNALWGISGMFLSIPLLAIIKLIFDRIEPLKPWGFLLGDTMPPLLKINQIHLKKVKKNYHDNS